jgi:uncharacterized surface protein with fasciclin (FAS1) repeats
MTRHLALLLSAALTSAAHAEPSSPQPPPASPSAAVTQATDSSIEQKNLPEALESAGFTRFASLLSHAGLTEALQGEQPFTCFAPTNEALEKLPAEFTGFIEKNPEHPLLVAWLKYHFFPDEVLDRDALGLLRGSVAWDGRFLTIWVTQGKILMDKSAEITRPDIRAANGIIHGISGILAPNEKTSGKLPETDATPETESGSP